MRSLATWRPSSDLRWSATSLLVLRILLVAFIASACISCSFFPKRELNGTAEERPKLAQDVLTTLNEVNATLNILYNSVFRGLNEDGQKSLDLYIVEAAAKNPEVQQQANVIKAGLEILVDLKSAKLDPVVLTESILALRRTILFFDTPVLRYIQEIGRTSPSTAMSLADDLFITNNMMAKALFTFAVIVERAGFAPADGKFETLRPEISEKAAQVAEKMLKLQPAIFISFQPHLVAALNLKSATDPSRNAQFEQTEFSLNSTLNGLVLATALQTQKGLGQDVTKEVITNSLKNWSLVIQKASTAVAQGEPPPELITIPERPPALDPMTGALPDGYPDWKFFAVEQPLNGQLDLTKNPPVYTPNNTFGNTDSYRIRACQQVVTSYCTEERLFTVNRPLPPWTVTLKTVNGNSSFFSRGVELVCEAALRGNDQIPIFTWWLQRAGETQLTEVTTLSSTAGRLTLNNISINDRISCKVFGESLRGLRSTSPKDSNTLIAMNSPPQNINLDPPLSQDSFPLYETVQTETSGIPSITNKREIARITVIDIDPLDSLANVIISECDGVTPCPFQVDNVTSDPSQKTAVLNLISPLNYELKPTYDLIIKAVDRGRPDLNFPGGAELRKNFRLNVINRNDPITAITPALVSVPENGPLLVSQLSAADEDCLPNTACQSTNYAYEFESIPSQGANQDSSFFEIVGRTLRFKGPTPPNFESAHSPEYVLKIRATDISAAVGDEAQVKSFSGQAKVVVTDVNELPNDIALSFNQIDENAVAGTNVGSVAAADVDAEQGANPDLFDYTLTELNGMSGNFELVGRNIRSKKVLDFEQLMNVLPVDGKYPDKRYFEVIVTAEDKSPQALSVTKTLRIYLNDKNEAPTNLHISKTVLQEQLLPTDSLSQIDLSATDPDTTAQNFSFQIKKINRNGENSGQLVDENLVSHPFVIVGSTLRLSRTLQYVNNSGVNDRYFAIQISVNDGQLEFSKNFTIQVSRLTLSNATFEENDPAADAAPDSNNPSQASRKITGSFCVDVADAQFCDAWTYSLKVPLNGLKIIGRDLYRTRAFNFESEPVVPITVVASRDGSQMERTFNLTVTDKNDPPTGIVFSSVNPPVGGKYYILEEDAAFTHVGVFEVADEDANAIINWDLANNFPDGDAFFTLTPRTNNSKLADLSINSAALPRKSPTRIGFKLLAKADDVLGLSSKEVEFHLISNAQLSVLSTPSAGDFFNKQTNTTPLTVDFRITDETDAAVCTPSSGVGNAGVFVLNSDSNLILSTLTSEKAAGAGYKECTLTVTARPNRSGEATLTLGVRWSTALGVRTSTSTLSIKVAFWRPPELNCPSRITLPVGESFANVPCAVAFSDGSSAGLNALPAVSIADSNCGLSLSTGLLSLASFPASACTTTVSWSGQNKYQSQIFNLSHPIELVPRKFSTNGAVKTIAKDASDSIYLGGSFTGVDPYSAPGLTSLSLEPLNAGTQQNPIVKYNGSRSESCNLTEGFNGVVRAIADAGDGSFWVGGDFTHYRSTPVNFITRLMCSGERVTWYPVGSGFNGPVYSIAKALDGSVFIGGKFSLYNGLTAQSVVKLNADGVRDTSFVSTLPANSLVNAIALTPSSGPASLVQSVWLGGTFSTYNGNAVFRNLVRVDQTGAVAENFKGGAFNLGVSALSVVSGGVIVGGTFTTYRGGNAQRLVKLDNLGDLDSSFHAVAGGFSDRVDSLANDGTYLYVAGGFASYRGSASNYLAKISLSDGLLQKADSTPPFSLPSINANVKTMLLIEGGSKLLIGGQFTSVGGQFHPRLALLDSTTGSVIPEFNDGLGFNGSVLSLNLFDGGRQALIGGEFSTFEGIPSARIAKFSSAGAFDSAFSGSLGSGFNGDVETLSLSGNDLYAGGSFTQLGGISQSRLAKINSTTGAPVLNQNFDIGSGFNGTVNTILKSPMNDDIYVGGRFDTYNGSAAPRLVRLKSDGTLDSEFSLGNGFSLVSGGSASVNALAATPVQSGEYSIYVGGEFDKFKDDLAVRLVKLDTTGVLVPDFAVSSGANQEIHTLALRGNDLFVGGQFSDYGGNATAARLARLNAETGELAAGGGYSVNGIVRALAVDHLGGVFVGGSFTAFNAVSSGPLIRLSPSNERDGLIHSLGTSHLNSTLASGIFALLSAVWGDNSQSTGMIFSGGVFSSFKYQSAPSLFRFDATSGAELSLP